MTVSRGRLRDWLTSPVEWEDWGRRLNGWMNELAFRVRSLWFESEHNAAYMQEDSNERLERVFLLEGASSLMEDVINGVRVRIQDETSHTEYADDGGTVLLQIRRTDGEVRIPETVGLTDLSSYYTTDWEDYNAGGNADPQIYKDADGFVHMQGLVRRLNTNTVAGTSYSVMTGLPAIYRPSATVIIPVAARLGVVSEIRVSNTGTINLISQSAALPHTNGFFSLGGVSWYVGH